MTSAAQVVWQGKVPMCTEEGVFRAGYGGVTLTFHGRIKGALDQIPAQTGLAKGAIGNGVRLEAH